jgi:citrate lyase subunit beta / citryl-CoA lyase
MTTHPSLHTLRSLLFVPGDDRRKIEKAAGVGADAVLLEMEDGVALNRKAEARTTVRAALAEVDFGRALRIVRINSLDTPFWRDDLAALVGVKTPPDALILPKTSHAAQIAELQAAGCTLPIVALIESGRGLLNVGEIATAAGVAALAFGAEDYSGDIGAVRTPGGDEVLMARSMVVLHAKTNGLAAIDTPYTHLDDEDGLRGDARRALTIGFTGKFAIHPRQVAVLHEVFTPTAAEIDYARRLIAAHDAHQAAGSGVFAFEGKMIDMPIIRAAERVLRMLY